MCAGFLSDRFGRKKMLFLCAVLYAVSGVLSALPRTFEQFLAARFLSGLGIGASSMICPVYIAEIAPERSRDGWARSFSWASSPASSSRCSSTRRCRAWATRPGTRRCGWRWMLGLEAVPAVMFLGLLFTVPESPRWLAQHGREDEARADLRAGRRPGACRA